MLKKFLMCVGIICIIVGFILGIYYGSVNGKEIYVNGIHTEESFNFGKFLIDFIKWNAFGLFGAAVCFKLRHDCPEF